MQHVCWSGACVKVCVKGNLLRPHVEGRRGEVDDEPRRMNEWILRQSWEAHSRNHDAFETRFLNIVASLQRRRRRRRCRRSPLAYCVHTHNCYPQLCTSAATSLFFSLFSFGVYAHIALSCPVFHLMLFSPFCRERGTRHRRIHRFPCSLVSLFLLFAVSLGFPVACLDHFGAALRLCDH